MIFNTWTFLVFFALALALYWAVIPARFRSIFLVVAGTVFYAFSVPGYLLLILGLGTITFGIGRAMLAATDQRQRKVLMLVGVVAITAVLVAFKYSKFFALTVNDIARHSILPVPNIVVPLAISFFTFEFVHVLVDVYVGKIVELKLTEFAVFTMFFPTLVAGPIKRYQTFAPQIRSIAPPGKDVIVLNAYRVMLGLAKKIVVADSMTVLTLALTNPSAQPFGRLDYIVAVCAYTAKIYFDFTGYSDIAIGLSGLLGIRIPENFDRPYWSENISVFWRRWHMSLSTWIRDYIFIPLGGSRRPPIITAINLFVAMALAGLWHGAAWTFVAWGLWHGLGLAAHRFWSQTAGRVVAGWRGPLFAGARVLSVIVTFGFVMVGWILFAASSFQDAALVFARAFL